MKKTFKKLLASLLIVALLLPSTPFLLRNIFSTKATAIDSSVTVGTEITLGHYDGSPIKWICVLVDDNGPLMLAKDVICQKEYDAAGNDSNFHSDGWGYIRKERGSNCWEDSNIRQWLNSSGMVNYSHCPPSYKDEVGFMSNFTEEEQLAIKKVTHKVTMVKYDSTRQGYCDGGSTDTFSYGKSFNIDNCYHKLLEDYFMLLDASQVNELKNNNSSYLTCNGSYFTAAISGNNYACFELVNPIGGGTNWACNNNGIRPAFYLNSEKYVNSIHQWFFDKDKTAMACSHCNETYYLSPNKNFKFGKDNFSFSHKDVASYDISEVGMKCMSPSLKLDFVALGLNKISHGVNYISNKIKNNNYGFWGGSCYGIACMDASFLSTLNVSNYGSSSVYGLSLDTKLKDSINIMMYSQASMFSLGNQVGNTFTNKNKAAVSAAKNISLNGYLPVLVYTGHAVNIIGILPDDYDPNYYVLSIYDCNSVDEPKFIIISKDYKKAYLGEFDLDNSDTPINITSGEIEIRSILTGVNNSIDLWAPGLSTSSLYTRSSQSSNVKKLSNRLETNSQDTEFQVISDDYIKLLLASDEKIVVTVDDDTYFVYYNGEIIETNIADIYCEDLVDLGVTKVIIPCTGISYKIESNNQYYANVSYDDRIAVFHCEKGGVSTFERNGIASIDTHITNSYSELSCYKYDMIADSDALGLLISNSSTNVKIDFSSDNSIVETSDFTDVNIKVQHNDGELSVEDIELTTETTEKITLKAESGNIVIEYKESENQNLCKFCGKEHEITFWGKFVAFFHKIFYFFKSLFK